MALTGAQKQAIAWADFAAGLATAETGFISFAIGAAASMAYYKDKVATAGWSVVSPTPGPIPSSSNDQGVLHNLTCEQYLAAGFPTVDYTDVINVASKVRPDLIQQLNSISEGYFNTNVGWAQSQDLSTPQLQLTMINGQIPLNGNDSNTVMGILAKLQGTTDNSTWITEVESFIQQVSNFTLPENEKTNLTNSLAILEQSFILWGA